MVSIIVPTYNEYEGLPRLVSTIFGITDKAGINTEMIIIDDNSPDGTGDLAEELAKKYPIKVIHRSGKLGLSSAVMEGFHAGSGEIFIVTDADLSHDVGIIPKMVELIENGKAQLVIGSRYIKGGGIKNWPVFRYIVSRGAIFLSRGLTKIKDSMSGFFALQRSVIESANLSPVGYKIGLEIFVKGKYERVIELPYVFVNRSEGRSKLSRGEFLNYLRHLKDLYSWKYFGKK
ncbi:MAG: polyprenol monophosphomannose synthase [Candidatus Eremiobacteraeota bacterium]|nr:polyprenol monophosphomannose synthase [Candidatus Eremiobacteraeota bacterium]